MPNKPLSDQKCNVKIFTVVTITFSAGDPGNKGVVVLGQHQ